MPFCASRACGAGRVHWNSAATRACHQTHHLPTARRRLGRLGRRRARWRAVDDRRRGRRRGGRGPSASGARIPRRRSPGVGRRRHALLPVLAALALLLRLHPRQRVQLAAEPGGRRCRGGRRGHRRPRRSWLRRRGLGPAFRGLARAVLLIVRLGCRRLLLHALAAGGHGRRARRRGDKRCLCLPTSRPPLALLAPRRRAARYGLSDRLLGSSLVDRRHVHRHDSVRRQRDVQRRRLGLVGPARLFAASLGGLGFRLITCERVGHRDRG
jgi:hypothetical protein